MTEEQPLRRTARVEGGPHDDHLFVLEEDELDYFIVFLSSGEKWEGGFAGAYWFELLQARGQSPHASSG